MFVCQWLQHVRSLSVAWASASGAWGFSAVLRGSNSPVSRRRFTSARNSRCSTSFQSMKRQPASPCSGLSAFCAAVCTSERSNCRNTHVLETKLTCSNLDFDFQKELGKIFGHLAENRVLSVSQLYVLRNSAAWRHLLGRPCMSGLIASIVIQGSLLRDPLCRKVGQELARKTWTLKVHSIGFLFTNNLCPHICNKCDRDEGARCEDMG